MPLSSPSVPMLVTGLLAAASFFFSPAAGQACTTINPTYGAPVMGQGYASRIVMNGLRTPRGIIFDTEGNLLVVESGGAGIRQIKLRDNGGVNVCVASSKQIVNDASLNHGIALSGDGRTLYVSSNANIFSYTYDPVAGTTSNKKTLITGMTQSGGHQSRTLLVPSNAPNLLLVARGSEGNLDAATSTVTTGRSIIRIWDNSSFSGATQQYSSTGTVLGWGLRNSVGVAENPATGGIWSVENSVDDMVRNNQDVHNDNPGEELNYHGIITDTASPERGRNYGYPDCFAAWNPATLPSNTNIKVGTQFLIGTASGAKTDAMCQSERIAPKLTFPSHTAPLDVRFKADGSAAFISFHGSWNRSPPDGYRLSRINISNSTGMPTEPSTSTTAAINVMSNANNANCPGRCFRPVGLAFDKTGRLFMSSDSSGEIYVITGA